MQDLVNRLLLFLCTKLFEMTESVYRLFYGLATTRLFTQTRIQEVSRNLYIMVSIVILFAFAVKLIEAIVNPDLLTDSKKGVTGVLKRTILGLVLIAAVPAIFNLAYKIQTEVIATSLVEKIILGYTEASTDSNSTAGVLTSSVIRGFVYPIDQDGVAITENYLCGTDSACNYSEELTNFNMTYQNYVSIIGGNPNYDEFGDINVEAEWENGNDMYYMNLFFLLLVGIYIFYQVVILCFDAALRLVNLGILEIMAPLIIVAYMGGGTDYLSKWSKMVVEKFISIFVRIAALAFMALGLRFMFEDDSIFFNQSTTFLFRLLIIIGLLRLIKDLPNIIGKIFGVDIKDPGGIKGRLGEMAGIGKLAQNAWSGMGGLAKGAAKTVGLGAAAAAGAGAKKFDKKVFKGKIGDTANKIAQSKLGRGLKVAGAGVSSKGKGTGKALRDAYDKNFKAEKYAAEQAEKKRVGEKMENKLKKSVGSILPQGVNMNAVTRDGKIDARNLVTSVRNNMNALHAQDPNNPEFNITEFNNGLLNASGMSGGQIDSLKKLSEAKANLSENTAIKNRRDRMKSRINGLRENIQNPADQARLDQIIQNIDRGHYTTEDQLINELSGLSMTDKGVTSELFGNMLATETDDARREKLLRIKADWDSGRINTADELQRIFEATGIEGRDTDAIVKATRRTATDAAQQFAEDIVHEAGLDALVNENGTAINTIDLEHTISSNQDSYDKAKKAADEQKEALQGEAKDTYSKYYSTVEKTVDAYQYELELERNRNLNAGNNQNNVGNQNNAGNQNNVGNQNP